MPLTKRSAPAGDRGAQDDDWLAGSIERLDTPPASPSQPVSSNVPAFAGRRPPAPSLKVIEHVETRDEPFDDPYGLERDPELRFCSGTRVVRPPGRDWHIADYQHEKRTAWTRRRVVIPQGGDLDAPMRGCSHERPPLRPRARACARRQVDRARPMDGEMSGHHERTGSLSIKDGYSGPLVYCFGGCAQVDVISALQDRGLWPRSTTAKRTTRRRAGSARSATGRRQPLAWTMRPRQRAKAARDLLMAKDTLRESFAPTPDDHRRHLPDRPRHRSALACLHPGTPAPLPSRRRRPRLAPPGDGLPDPRRPHRRAHRRASHLPRRGRRQGRRRPSEEGARPHHRRRDQADARRGCDGRARRLRRHREPALSILAATGRRSGRSLPPATSQPSRSCPASRR